MSEISSGLVAVAEVGSGFSIRWTEPDYGGSCKPYDMLVRLSDAEAIINDLQNLVVAENQRKQQLEEERDTWKERAEFSYAQRDKQAERIKELEAVIEGFKQDQEEMIANEVKQSAALKLAREALFDMQDSYAAVHGWKDSFVIAATTAIAAIDNLLKGE